MAFDSGMAVSISWGVLVKGSYRGSFQGLRG